VIPKIAIAGLIVLTGMTVYASYAGWGIAKPVRETKSVRHGSRRVTRTRGHYYHHYGRTHGHYYGK
jgi:hypothetical protein